MSNIIHCSQYIVKISCHSPITKALSVVPDAPLWLQNIIDPPPNLIYYPVCSIHVEGLGSKDVLRPSPQSQAWLLASCDRTLH